ncbi:hypothetical protein SCATT_41510 [Streptantibioticus cattleyicolor NRRL 8057 = DSM 46488]|uniref:Uncharacterized protein n=1 Tax=Streptantibioticus cattleyicolor (strain ATCC 35852 / DSM 46488 / JCM 4925 / NBRC 14057 / NRRL 8057) TaxID=1003195 RepID=G8X0C7_STREN|nr:hypothetical protein SCATT_41510 [Streptantibioticus cattleyicolor NRRL 8057 = DSM 46488]
MGEFDGCQGHRAPPEGRAETASGEFLSERFAGVHRPVGYSLRAFRSAVRIPSPGGVRGAFTTWRRRATFRIATDAPGHRSRQAGPDNHTGTTGSRRLEHGSRTIRVRGAAAGSGIQGGRSFPGGIRTQGNHAGRA